MHLVMNLSIRKGTRPNTRQEELFFLVNLKENEQSANAGSRQILSLDGCACPHKVEQTVICQD